MASDPAVDPLLQQRWQEDWTEFWRYVTTPSALVVCIAGALSGIVWRPRAAVVVIALVVLVGLVSAAQKSQTDWWQTVVRTLGMTQIVAILGDATPLLRAGRLVVVNSARDDTRHLIVLTSIDGPNRESGEERGGGYCTLVTYDLAPHDGFGPALGFMAAYRRSTAGLGDEHRGDLPAGTQEPHLESVELSKRFTLRCEADQFDLLQRVFGPEFILWFQEHGHSFEFQNGKLVVFQPGQLQRLADFQSLVATADAIHTQLQRQLVAAT